MSWQILSLYFSPYSRNQSGPVKLIVKGQGVGANWAQEAYDYVGGHLPAINDSFQFLQSVTIDEALGFDGEGNQFFAGTATYGPAASAETPEQAVVAGRAEDEAEPTLQSARLYCTESPLEIAESVTRFPSTAGVLPDNGKLIKTASGLGVPALEVAGDFTLQKKLPADRVSAYLKDVIEPLLSPRPRMNNATFWGRPAGSVLIVEKSVSFSGPHGIVQCSFRYKPNLSSATIAGITGVTANGHDHLEAYYKTETVTSSGKTFEKKTLLGFYVYQLYKSGDFTTLKMDEP